MASGSLKAFKLALIQLKVTASKRTNLNNARRLVLNASNEGADMVVLPECFNSPYGTSYFPTYAEQFPNGESFQALSAMAKEANVYLIGGSLPEQSEDGKSLFNTCTIWNKNGSFITTHRKIHLFDINVPGKITFKESDVLSSGHQLTQFDTPWGPIGIGICYDIRFPELAMIAARKGCIAMIYPGAFNMTTGKLNLFFFFFFLSFFLSFFPNFEILSSLLQRFFLRWLIVLNFI